MNIPNFEDVKFVETEGQNKGMLTETWRGILSQIIQQLQLNASDESLVAPSQTTSNILTIQNAGEKYKGGLIYDSTTNQLKVGIYNPISKTNTFQVVQTG